MRKKIFSIVFLAVAVFVLFQIAAVEATDWPDGAYSASVSGVIYDSNNQPLAETWVKIYTANNDLLRSATSNAAGYYFISDLEPDTYVIKVHAPSNYSSLISPDPIEIILNENDYLIQDFYFSASSKIISGTITLADQTPVNDAKIEAYQDGRESYHAYSDTMGNYTLSVASGSWNVNVYPSSDSVDWYYNQEPSQVTFADNNNSEEININFVVSSSMVLPTMAGIEGTVTNPSGQPMINAWVKIYATNDSFESGDATDELGQYFVNDLAPGSYIVETYPPDEFMHYIAPNSVNVTLEADMLATVNLQFTEAIKTIKGKVTYTDQTAVSDAKVKAFKDEGEDYTETYVDAAGNYSLKVGSGNWLVMPEAINNETTNWSYTSFPQAANFSDNNIPEEEIINFSVVKARARVKGRILNPNGSVPEPYKVRVNISGSFGPGGDGDLDTTGAFSIAVPDGTYTLSIFSEDPSLGIPSANPFSVISGQVLDLGTIYLIQRTSYIKGRVTDAYDQGLTNISVSAFQSDQEAYNGAKTDEAGYFSLYVDPGDWKVAIYPMSESNYVYTDPPQQVTISSNDIVDLDFTLTLADTTINGKVVDGAGNILTNVYGWAYAETETEGYIKDPSSIGANIEQGLFTIKAPAGTYKINVHLPANADYSPGTGTLVSVGTGQTKDITIKLNSNNAIIKGYLTDSYGQAITQKMAHVFVSGKGGLWQEADINLNTGQYVIRVSAGTWYLGIHLESDTGHSPLPKTEKPIIISSGQTVARNIILVKADTSISGTITNTQGIPLANVWVSAGNKSLSEEIEGEPDKNFMAIGAETNSSGNFSFIVPAGTYYLHAFLPPEFGYINPEEKIATVAADATAQANLVFRKTDSKITGLVYLNGLGTSAFIWAWSEKGGFTEIRSTNQGNFTLNVAKNDIWHIGAVKESGKNVYKSHEMVVNIQNEDSVSQNLDLIRTDLIIPDSVSTTAKADKSRLVAVEDGAKASIPANFLANSGQIIVTMDPEVELPTQGLSKVVGVGYSLEARSQEGKIIEFFDDDIALTLPYTIDQLNDIRVNEDDIGISFWDVTAGVWKELDNSVVDKSNKVVTAMTNHFTYFAILGVPTEPSGGGSASIQDGDLIRNPNAEGMAQFDIYIAKFVGDKKFKRLVISPHVFESYEHFDKDDDGANWDDVIDIDSAIMDPLIVSDLVREDGTEKVYHLKTVEGADSGQKQWLNISASQFDAQYDSDSIYIINNADTIAYEEGLIITE